MKINNNIFPHLSVIFFNFNVLGLLRVCFGYSYNLSWNFVIQFSIFSLVNAIFFALNQSKNYIKLISFSLFERRPRICKIEAEGNFLRYFMKFSIFASKTL